MAARGSEGKISELHLIDPTPELPDDTQIADVRFPTRLRNVLAVAGLKTVGEVRETAANGSSSAQTIWNFRQP
jgi:hypothetical protein